MQLTHLRERRDLRGLTQRGLADRAGVTQDAISNYETGRRNARLSTARKLAEALGCRVDDLAGTPGRRLSGPQRGWQRLPEPRCGLCGWPVRVHRALYDVHERMHWLCFHVVYEHDADPDEPCSDPSCPQWHLEVFREELRAMGRDPDRVLREAIDERATDAENA